VLRFSGIEIAISPSPEYPLQLCVYGSSYTAIKPNQVIVSYYGFSSNKKNGRKKLHHLKYPLSLSANLKNRIKTLTTQLDRLIAEKEHQYQIENFTPKFTKRKLMLDLMHMTVNEWSNMDTYSENKGVPISNSVLNNFLKTLKFSILPKLKLIKNAEPKYPQQKTFITRRIKKILKAYQNNFSKLVKPSFYLNPNDTALSRLILTSNKKEIPVY